MTPPPSAPIPRSSGEGPCSPALATPKPRPPCSPDASLELTVVYDYRQSPSDLRAGTSMPSPYLPPHTHTHALTASLVSVSELASLLSTAVSFLYTLHTLHSLCVCVCVCVRRRTPPVGLGGSCWSPPLPPTHTLPHHTPGGGGGGGEGEERGACRSWKNSLVTSSLN